MLDPLPGDIFAAGDIVNHTYRIQGILGRGGMSEVYLARNLILDQAVAIKVLSVEFSRGENSIDFIARELVGRNLQHPAILQYFDCGLTEHDRAFIVMDYVSGRPLSHYMSEGRLDVEDLLKVLRRVCEGLVAAHEAGYVHRDLSPDNIILRDGHPEKAVIIDFGIAKDLKSSGRTIIGNRFAGKLEYAAPEQFQGRTDHRSDLYSLGASLLAVHHRAIPFLGLHEEEIEALKARPLDTIGLPSRLNDLLAWMTNPQPDQRPQSARAVLERMDRTTPIPMWVAISSVAALAGVVAAAALWFWPEPATATHAVAAALEPYSTCGPLEISGDDEGVFPPGSTIRIAGNIADEAMAPALRQALEAASGDRMLDTTGLTVLWPALCAILEMLPAERRDSIEVALGWGDRSDVNVTGVYAENDTVVVDLLLSARARGHLTVILADSSQNDYLKLVPVQFSGASDLNDLGDVSGNLRRIRVLYNDAEYFEDQRLAYVRINNEPGKIALLALLTERPFLSAEVTDNTSLDEFRAELGRSLTGGSMRVQSSMIRLIDSR